MKWKTISFTVFYSCITFLSFGQEISRRTQKKYQEALQFVTAKKLDAAIATLKECVREAPDFAPTHQVLADVLRKKERYTEAESYYQKVISLNPDLSPITYFGLGEVQLALGKYKDAKNNFESYLKKAPPKATESIKKAEKNILDCNFAQQALLHPVPYEPKNMGKNINSKAQEYLPTLTADEKNFIFTRRIHNNEDFYRSVKENNQWSYALPLRGAINTKYNEGSQSITPDGRYLFFAGCNRNDGLGRCDIYMSTLDCEEWSAAQNLGSPINSGAWESQPSISADGNTLYFASNKQGGYGGYDIWKSNLQKDGSWSEPENLGPSINTPYDEMSPYIHADGINLYFASNGWPGMGKKDIFMSKLNKNNQWSEAKNIGYPINTFEEESSFIVSADGKKSFFAADRSGGYGGLDIYQLTTPENIRPNPVSYVFGKVYDKNNQEVLLADVQVIDLKSNKVVYENITEPNKGTFLAVMPSGGNYALYVSKNGYMFYSANFGLDDQNYTELKPFEIQVDLEQIQLNAETILANIFFDTNKYDLLPLSLLELEKLQQFMIQNPKVKISIEGHTDNMGSDDLNQKLSFNRAKAVYDFLIKNGMNQNRLSHEGFGENKPIASNETMEGRQQNRRTSFKIVDL